MKSVVELDNFTEMDVSGLKSELKVRLQALRYEAALPIFITSGLRVGDPKSHGQGDAVDISDNPNGDPPSPLWRYHVLRAAFLIGFKRIGIYDRHIHIDISETLPREVAWWGVSD